jgi:NAD(P)-dependent dehydrogenase (short-subunit alcohol dehydrogenase family)
VSATPPLAGEHAVVTGGSRGIGAVIAEALTAAGARVTVMGRDARDLEVTAARLAGDTRADVRAVACDVSDAAAVESAFTDAAAGLGLISILVNNAGQSHAAPAHEMSLEAWQRQIDVNLTGTFLCAQRVLPGMLSARRGRIVNIASIAGLKGFALVAGYCASKHGVIGLTRALALETARHGITVNAVCPGYTEDTGMLQSAVDNLMRAKGRTAEEARAALTRPSPRGTLVTPAEVASVVVWLCSPGASAITGQAIAVAGGEVTP